MKPFFYTIVAFAIFLATGCTTTTGLMGNNSGQAKYEIEDCSAGEDKCITASIFNTKDIGELSLTVDKQSGTLTLDEKGVQASSPIQASVEAMKAQAETNKAAAQLVTDIANRVLPGGTVVVTPPSE